LPGFNVFIVVFFLVVVIIVVFVDIVVVLVDVVFTFNIVVEPVPSHANVESVVAVCHEGVSVVGFALSRLGGGYVVQKWRPQRGHTQNWSGVQGMPGPGSRMSIWVPQRMQRIWRSPSLIAAIL
jgi:hypothetical protein